MRRDVRMHALWLAIATLITCTTADTSQAQTPAHAQAPLTGIDLVRSTYSKFDTWSRCVTEHTSTAVYVPKDDSQRYPFLITRTPYSLSPYGVDQYPAQLVFMEIPTAKPSDFKKATQRVYRSGAMASSITVMVQQ